jgi:hypothetical protein
MTPVTPWLGFVLVAGALSLAAAVEPPPSAGMPQTLQ